MRLCFWNDNFICASQAEYDVKLHGHVWLDAPVDYDPSKMYKLVLGVIEEIPVSVYDPKRLRVHRVLPMGNDPLISDFTILGFRKIAPYYDRGVKYKAVYKCATHDEVIVEKVFTDIRDSVTGVLTDLQILFNFYCEDGTIGASKTEISKSYNAAQAETEERKRRERAIDFLISEARHTPLEPLMDAIFSHYQNEQLFYKEKASTSFADAINAETDPTMLDYLATQVPFSSDPTNYTIDIKSAILYQIHNIDEAQLLANLNPIT